MRRFLQQLNRAVLRLGARAHRPETADALVLTLVLAAGWWMTAQQGGARAEALPAALRLMLAALTLHGASLLIPREDGVRISRLGLLGVPFVAWLALDCLCLAPDRGAALTGLCQAGMVAAGWYLTLHHARRTWSLLVTLALVAAPAALLACGAFDLDDRHIRGLLGVVTHPAYAGHFVSAMGSPGACAAVMLLALMPPLALALNPGLKLWKRAVAGYFAALLTLGLMGTHHAWAWLAFALGLAAMVWRIQPSLRARLATLALASLVGWMLAPAALAKVGVLRTLPDDADGALWLARAAAEAFLGHPLLGGGAGSFPLDFELARPAGWQTDPSTCGSLPLQILTEHGLLGALVLLAPVGWIVWRCLRSALNPLAASPEAVAALGGRSRVATRESLRLGATTGALGAGLVLAIDYPAALPGLLLLVVATAAAAFRLTQEGETEVLPDGVVRGLGVACLLLPALAAPTLVAPLEGASLAAQATGAVQQASPDSLSAPTLLNAEAQARLAVAAEKLERASRLNPLDGSARAWHAQALALLMRQSPEDLALQGRARAEGAEAVRLAPRSAWAHAVLGSILLAAREPEQRDRGLSHLRTAARLSPMNQSVALRAAQALGQSGAPAAELRAAYERALLTNPSRSEVQDKLTLLRSTDAKETPGR